jgi:hypothetical protein
MPNQLNLVGQRFGRVLVIASAGVPLGRTNRAWLCRCDCGEERVLFGISLASGNNKSCGCYRQDRLIKHGQSNSPTYCSWKSMHSRCSNPNKHDWNNYGGRGIKVCAQWSGPQGFQQFLLDMGERPPGTTLDRYPNNDGNYEPGNVRWATPKQQRANQRPKPRLSDASNAVLQPSSSPATA